MCVYLYPPPTCPAHALLRENCQVHATSGDCAEAQYDSQETLRAGPQWEGEQVVSKNVCVVVSIISCFFLFCFVCMNVQIYPYLVLNDNQVARCRSEERVLQLLNLVNLFLAKDKVSRRGGTGGWMGWMDHWQSC